MAAAGALITWLALFAWDSTYHRDALGQLTGPYEKWQIYAAALVLICLGLITSAGWKWSAFAIPPVLTTCFAITDSRAPGSEQGLWPLAVVFLAVPSFGVAAACATASPHVRALLSRESRNACTAQLWRVARGRGLLRYSAKVSAAGAAAGAAGGAIFGAFMEPAVASGLIVSVVYATLLAFGRRAQHAGF